ncbi:MAG: triose-phosphate isomerase [Candidatus Dormibacteria bacterium]
MPLVAGNWKMNTSIDEGVRLAEAVRDATEGSAGIEVAVLPPFTHLRDVYDVVRHSHVELGAQDVFWEAKGAYTGEISPAMLAGWCRHALVGHSERRHLLGESDEQVGRKFTAALGHGLHVIVAVGETEAERDAGDTHTVIDRQLAAAFRFFSSPPRADSFVVAYEPVWAIGTGRTATPEQAQEVCAHVKERVQQNHGVAAIRVLYGGSVSGDNASSLFAQPDIDGALVGGASLRAAEFATIAAAATGAAAAT